MRLTGRRLARWIATGACVGLLVGCGTNPAPLTALRAMAEGTLLPGGCVAVGTYASNEQQTIEGTNYAVFGHLVGTMQTQDEVISFFATELPRRGWAPQPYGTGPATTQTMAMNWVKGDVEFHLAFWRPGQKPLPPTASGGSFPVVFDALLISEPWRDHSSQGPSAS